MRDRPIWTCATALQHTPPFRRNQSLRPLSCTPTRWKASLHQPLQRTYSGYRYHTRPYASRHRTTACYLSPAWTSIPRRIGMHIWATGAPECTSHDALSVLVSTWSRPRLSSRLQLSRLTVRRALTEPPARYLLPWLRAVFRLTLRLLFLETAPAPARRLRRFRASPRLLVVAWVAGF